MDAELLITAIIAGVVGCLVGYLVTDSGWQKDCKHLGAHVTEAAVFKCELRESKQTGLPAQSQQGSKP